MTRDAARQRQLPLRKAAQIAWRGIRVRFWRSILVTLGILLPVAFLAYMLLSGRFGPLVAARGAEDLVSRLAAAGLLDDADSGDAVIQTRWMVGLALLISFVGILNAMLMSVTERFREIGTMKCLGALDAFIIRLFLLESAFQGLVGSLLGVAAGTALAVAEGRARFGPEAMALVGAADLAPLAALALAGGVFLTLAGAAYPALRAARMKPVDAMRTEI